MRPISGNKRKWLKVVLIIVVVMVVLRLLMPFFVLRYTNKKLTEMKGYYGHVSDIDIALFRGAYEIDSIYINKMDSSSQKQTLFFAASQIDLSVEWKALLHGALVGELIFEAPTLKFTKDKVEPNDLRNDSSSFKNLLDDFMPLQVNRFEIRNGRVRYIDEFSHPPVDIQLSQLKVIALNLKNSYDSSSLLPAHVEGNAKIYEGDLNFEIDLNPLADEPTFDMNTELKNTNLVLLNDFFQAYAKIDVNKGTFGMYAEVAAKDGTFKGYVKPLMKDLDVLGKEDRNDNFLRKLWEGIAGGLGQLFRNQPKDQVATKIPFQGKIDKPRTNLWSAIFSILQNAFIQALQPSLDYEINIRSVSEEK